MERFTAFSNPIDQTHVVLEDGKHFQTVRTASAAIDLAIILNAVATLAGRDGAVSANPEFQREVIAHALAKSLGFRAEKRES